HVDVEVGVADAEALDGVRTHASIRQHADDGEPDVADFEGPAEGASVVKKRARTPSPMMATGRPSSTWSGVNHPPAASSRLVRRKYVVSTPTTFPERCRPSRVMVVLRTISALVTSTAGITRAIACASA